MPIGLRGPAPVTQTKVSDSRALRSDHLSSRTGGSGANGEHSLDDTFGRVLGSDQS